MKKFRIVLVLVLLAGIFVVSDSAIASLTMSTPVATIDPLACTMTVTWTTVALSSTKVYYGTSCGSLNYTATGANCVANHSVTFDVTSFGNVRIYFKAESATNCETEESDCLFKKRGYCIKEE
jgi:hypothetical protein